MHVNTSATQQMTAKN